MAIDPCPWCGEDVEPQGGLEAHMSEPCEPWLAEAGPILSDRD